MKPSLPPPPRERGQSLVEFGISLLVLLLLLTGAVETGIALFQYVTIRDAAQEGALYGSIYPTDEEGIQANAAATANDVVDIPTANVIVTINDMSVADAIAAGQACEDENAGTPNWIKTNITFEHPVTFPFIEAFVGNGITLHASATNTILQPVCAP